MTEKILDNAIRLTDEEIKRLKELEMDFLIIGFSGFFGCVTNVLAGDKAKTLKEVKEIQEKVLNESRN